MPSAKKKPKAVAPYVPAKTQLEAYQVQLENDGAVLKVPVGNILSWPTHLTRPIVDHDVTLKMEAFVDKDGWLPSLPACLPARLPAFPPTRKSTLWHDCVHVNHE